MVVVRDGQETPNEATYSPPRAFCYDPFQSLYLEVDGKIRTCCVSSTIFGNAMEEDIEDIWRGYKYNLFREMMITEPMMTECANCLEARTNQPAWFG